ncbi:Asp-tRNA(Asn)/Glu-tRNA(Gln) amidotransferase subunit GatA [Methylacidimicrobium sp. B4]|uniref:Asp-tRNA(Asn)/Glu-tRNA(Gln) amidotransferase subunit GatA n=1 Tax=Methylacidimicrobium sp. B4 TaxID=2796139 RepID=UPI001A8FF83C|nr:Asp-tRNA(Asn)/Glu-tRNA(Gln) amidotransferase subunit GatA [Methylacidimicrobium sp. B4]QSR84547.1 Asp-tRNA(Asn)/Glu-tRNA(Gln) amidotransferase subunit GatA [Methylacidimicrobium sp. B4]
MSLAFATIQELRRRLRAKEVHPRELVEALLDRISSVDPKVKAYNYLHPERALESAQKADISLPLGGVPIAIKDLINVRGEPCTCASRILEGYIAPYDATVIERLRAAGAILLGRTNMDEFAMGSSTENSAWGVTRNPWDLSRVPGGSSGGSAAAVAAHEAIAALGSDTGGSIRQPASFCGCVGLKPTYGRVSRYGLTAFASSLDQIGPLTKTVADAALVLESIAGVDPRDNTCDPTPAPSFSAKLGEEIRGMTLGIPKEYFVSGIDPEVEDATRQAISHLEGLGATLREISLPHTAYSIASYYLVATAEASANLARFDGMRYGRRAKECDDLLETYGRTRDEGFGREVKRRILLGTYALSSGYYDAYYLRAQKVRMRIREDFLAAFRDCQAIVTPTSPTPAFRLGERAEDPLQMYLADIFTIAVNLAGLCAISLPCGFTRSGLPIGLQIIGPMRQEETILQVGYAYEQSTDWHTLRPSLS